MSIHVVFREPPEITSHLDDASNHLASLDRIIGIANILTELPSDAIPKRFVGKNIDIHLEQYDIALHCRQAMIEQATVEIRLDSRIRRISLEPSQYHPPASTRAGPVHRGLKPDKMRDQPTAPQGGFQKTLYGMDVRCALAHDAYTHDLHGFSESTADPPIQP